jgi:hypothetical protein
MSISLDSKANPVTRDPNYFIFGIWLFKLLTLLIGDG